MTDRDFRYNPAFSVMNIIPIILGGRLKETHYFHQTSINTALGSYEIFKSIYIRQVDDFSAGKSEDSVKDNFNQGEAQFQVAFKSSKMTDRTFEAISGLTIPFFCGLPGFRSKHFLINRQTGEFSGLYRWNSIQNALNYAHSFAVKMMKNQSHPCPVKYNITDLRCGEIIEEKAL